MIALKDFTMKSFCYYNGMAIPKYDELFNPTLSALHQLGGSGRNDEIEQKVAEILNLTDDEVNEIHIGNRTKLGYRSAWARNYLKRYGLIENSQRGVWSLTHVGLTTKSVEKDEVNRTVKRLASNELEEPGGDLKEIEELEWEEEVLETLRAIEPAAFERLCQRLLRESGFVEVTVEGRSGDGGIDGRGIYKVGGLISTRVIFQAKRYSGSVSSQQVREFKGTMSGRAEKGLFITTGTFTRDAKTEAIRDGSTAIDLVDGRALADLLKDLRMGMTVTMEESVSINKTWFQKI
jgi:restriction system protein